MTNPNYSQFGTATPETGVTPLSFGVSCHVEEGPQFVLLPNGAYNFVVKDYNISDYPGSAKLPPCKCFTVNLMIDGEEKGVGSCRNNFYLCTTNVRFLRDFLASVGKIAPGATDFTLTPSLLDVAGLKGRGEFSTREYNGKTYQNLKKALPPRDKMGQALPF